MTDWTVLGDGTIEGQVIRAYAADAGLTPAQAEEAIGIKAGQPLLDVFVRIVKVYVGDEALGDKIAARFIGTQDADAIIEAIRASREMK